MLFVNPLFLFGLFAISLPVIVHLFNFRKFKKVFFTNVRFLQQLKQETQKQSRLRHLIILLLRVLAVAALVFAFAQPYIPYNEGQAPIAARNTISIFVDNSFSMEAIGSNGSLLDEAIHKAREIAAAYKPSDQFQLLTNNFEGKHQRLLTRDEFLTSLEEIKPGPYSRTLPEIVSRQSDLLSQGSGSRKSVFILSDFQKNEYQQLLHPADSTMQFYYVPLKANAVSNVYIDTCWFDLPLQQPGQSATLNVRLWNKSSTDLEKIPVKLEIGGMQRAIASADLKAGASSTIRMSFNNKKPGIQQGFVEVTDYPVTYDDRFYFSYEVTSTLELLAINGQGPNKFLNALFNQDSSVRLSNLSEKALDYSRLSQYNLIILNELQSISSGLANELKKYVEAGGSLLFIPSSNPDLVSCNSFLASVSSPLYQSLDTSNSKVVKLNLQHPVFRDVFEKQPGSADGLPENTELPLIFRSFPMKSQGPTQTQSLLKLLNGNDMLSVTQYMSGQVFQLSVPIDPTFTNLPRQAIFVPAFYNIALVSRPPAKLYYTAGQNEAIRVNHAMPAGDQVFRIRSTNGDLEVIPELQRLGAATNVFTNGQIVKAGNYQLFSTTDTISGISFNYNRLESDPECLDNDKLEALAQESGIGNFSLLKTDHKPVNEVLEELNFGIRLWKYFVVFALLCLLAESILLRLWKY
ncbi:MAG: BatA domain-containing protein [Bacteroidales bacterium]|nr:BatA domain-containing protein [Bacteroidales bacterium]